MMVFRGPPPPLLLILLLSLPFFSIAGGYPSPPSPPEETISVLDALSDVVQLICFTKDWNVDDVRVSSIDSDTVRFTRATAYELDVGIHDQIFPTKFIDDVSKWQHLRDFKEALQEYDCEGKLSKVLWDSRVLRAVLTPFQLSGPVGILFKESKTFQDSSQETEGIAEMNLTIGSSVEVEGAQEVSLAHPVELPLFIDQRSPLRSLMGSILALFSKVRNDSVKNQNDSNLLSVCIKGSEVVANITTAPQTSPESDPTDLYNGKNGVSKSTLHTGRLFDKSSVWPFPLLDISNPRYLMLEQVMKVYLSSSGLNNSFTILRAEVAALTFILFEFEIERKLNHGDFDPVDWPDWKTRPTVERRTYQVLAKVRDNKILPILAQPLKQYKNVDTHSWRDDASNVSYTRFSSYLETANAMTLDVD